MYLCELGSPGFLKIIKSTLINFDALQKIYQFIIFGTYFLEV